MEIQIKRIYDDAAQNDGLRVLVDRLWPRGIKKEDADVDLWAKDLAPSDELRKEFNHDPEKFDQFAQDYEKELAERDEAADLIEEIKDEDPDRMTLLYAARDKECNHALVLQRYLQKHIAGASFASPRSV
ncbi:DUF488 family protein [Rothia sp. LK2588]|uniref:DUF488 domain-containing protein n=1 Tax=Rothia sp. LK2588 TaxID=3114369 RepID=UPI0034CDCED3